MKRRCIRYRGFTFVELSIGLVVLAILMLAIAGIMTAVAQGWNDQETTQSTQIQANQVYARVQHILSAAKYVILPANNSSGTSIIFWANDNFNGTSDGLVEAGEVSMITQDPTTNTLYLYQSMPVAQMSTTQFTAASAVLNWAALQLVTPATVKAWPFITLPPTVLGGPGTLSHGSSYLQVTSAQFYPTELTGYAELPVVEFSLTFTRNGQTVTLYNSTTLRGPTTQPS